MVIREMQAQDVEAVTALEAACFTQPWKRHDFEDIHESGQILFCCSGR